MTSDPAPSWTFILPQWVWGRRKWEGDEDKDEVMKEIGSEEDDEDVDPLDEYDEL